MKKQSNYVKKLKKLSVKAGDIVVITLKGLPYPSDIENIRAECETMPFMKGVNLIIVTEKIELRKSKPKNGKHSVLLDNLEYLEYLAKHKGDIE